MKLYHGSENIIEKPVYGYGKKYNDYGVGFYCTEDIFPLTNIVFENMIFPAPAKCNIYLSKIFGANYMQVPRGGILYHEEGRGALSTWAKKNNIDMQIVCNILKSHSIND